MTENNQFYENDTAGRRREERLARMRRRKRKILLMRIAVLFLAAIIAALGIVLYFMLKDRASGGTQAGSAAQTTAAQGTAAAQDNGDGVVTIADAPEDKQADAADGNTAADVPAAPGENAGGADSASASGGNDSAAQAADAPAQPSTEAAPAADSADTLAQAKLLAAGYDYDGAAALIQAVPGYESNSDLTAALEEFEAAKASCVPVDVNTVPHIFYHSLINDTDRAFNVSVLGQFAVDGMNAWMTTVDEFDKITQALYDNGYVYVRLRDLVVQTTHEDGSVTFEPNTQLMLPEGKKAIVLSVDDLSYYHSYEAAGFPEKLVLDENGLVKCRYTDAAGNTQVGDFDVVPRLNTFLREHPDGAYRGARGLIALTGYNGVFGYRTDIDYEVREHLVDDQRVWLENHPDFNRQEDIEQATVIAEAIKNEGWEFASHTWGHVSVTGVDASYLQTDNEKWINNVQNIVGPVDTIIFAHGNDIGSWEGYSSDNDKYSYYKNAGYNFYCNVDGSVPYWVQITSDYVRQGRIDLDGYMLYQSSQGQTTVLDNMFKASEVFDQRRPTPVVANGQG